MSRIEFKTRNIAFGKFLERELKMQSVRSCEFERACGISKDALNRIKKGLVLGTYPHYYYEKILLTLLSYATCEEEAQDIKERWGKALGEFEVVEDRKK